jgi:hypothetical protein
MRYKFAFCLVLMAAVGTVANAQGDPDDIPALQNIDKLEASISLDRAVYVPGEVAKITLRYRNPTDQVLEVIHPFWPRRTGFDLWVKGGPMAVRYGLEYGPIGQHTYADFPPDSSAPTVQLLPGDVLTRTFRSDDPILRGHMPLTGGILPRRPGKYRISYSYAPLAEADFEVKAPILEQTAQLELYEERILRAGEAPFQVSRCFHGVVLAVDGTHLILKGTGSTCGGRLPPAGGVVEQDVSISDLGKLERVAESPTAVTGLRLEKLADGRVKFLWLNGSGVWNETVVPGETPYGTIVPVGITITPVSATANAGQKRRFKATVTGLFESGALYSAALGPGAPVGADPGVVTWEGIYVAPTIVSNNYPVIVTARSRANPSLTASATVSLLATEVIQRPAAPSGPGIAQSGVLQQYTASGAASNLDHPVQYTFDWGDGSFSGWTPRGVTGSYHTWSRVGVYQLKVQARCADHPDVVSSVSPDYAIGVSGEYLSVPRAAAGPAVARVGVAASYSTGGSQSNLPGHEVQYRFMWGDGSVSPWLPVGTTSTSQTWAVAGTYQVKVEARCATHREVLAPEGEETTVRVDP